MNGSHCKKSRLCSGFGSIGLGQDYGECARWRTIRRKTRLPDQVALLNDVIPVKFPVQAGK